MTETKTQSPETAASTPAKKAPRTAAARRKKKVAGRKKRAKKLATNKDFAKQYFEAKSKRSVEKKSGFRKKKSKKK